MERYRPQVVRLLLLTNASIDERTNAWGPVRVTVPYHGDMTAMHFAAWNGHGAILVTLLEAGAHVNVQDDKGVDGTALGGGERPAGRGRAAPALDGARLDLRDRW